MTNLEGKDRDFLYFFPDFESAIYFWKLYACVGKPKDAASVAAAPYTGRVVTAAKRLVRA
jgi:hypothetical protein